MRDDGHAALPGSGTLGRRFAGEGRIPASALPVLILGAALAVFTLVQLHEEQRLRRTPGFLGAAEAHAPIHVYAYAGALLVVLACVLTRRFLWVVPAAAGAAAAVVLALGAVGAHRAWSIALAALTLSSAWLVGRGLLRLRVLGGGLLLEAPALVPLTAGLGALGFAIWVLGRLELIYAWSTGIPVVVVGTLGLVPLCRAAWQRRGDARSVLGESRLRAAALAVLLIQLAWALIWASAPDNSYDALYAKAWLPEVWAQTHRIGPMVIHPILSLTGYAQIVAVPGHTLDGTDTGRFLQLLCGVLIVAAVWSWGDRFSRVGGPLAALAIAITPQVIWQSSTAYDDLVLSLVCVGLALAVLHCAALRLEQPLAVGAALGFLAGTCASFKYTLVALCGGMILGFVVLGIRDRSWWRRLAGAVAGAVALVAPGVVLRWYDTGNPVFPQYNEIFRSQYFPPVNATWGMPYWHASGLTAPFRALWDVAVAPGLMQEVLPAGAYGLLGLFLLSALAFGWRRRTVPAQPAVWIGLVIGTVAWWIVFRYLRYLLPALLVATLLAPPLLAPVRAFAERLLEGRLGVLACAGVALLFFPSTVAGFWNTPGDHVPVAAARGAVSGDEVRLSTVSGSQAARAFGQIAEPGALAVSDAFARTLLPSNRDLTPPWELNLRQSLLPGPQPTTAEQLRRVWSRLGVRWMIVHRTTTLDPSPWSPLMRPLVDTYGQPVWSDGGWQIFHLVPRVVPPRPVPTCDPTFSGASGCWSGTTPLDSTPGLVAAEGAQTQQQPACPGATYVADLTLTPKGGSATVGFTFDAANPVLGNTGPQVITASHEPAFGTAPPGVHHVTVSVAANGAAVVHSVRLGVERGTRC
jgi:hypothetical protein